MPMIQVNMASGRTNEEKKRLLHEVTAAVEASLGVSRASIRVWINEFKDTEFMVGGVLLSDRTA